MNYNGCCAKNISIICDRDEPWSKKNRQNSLHRDNPPSAERNFDATLVHLKCISRFPVSKSGIFTLGKIPAASFSFAVTFFSWNHSSLSPAAGKFIKQCKRWSLEAYSKSRAAGVGRTWLQKSRKKSSWLHVWALTILQTILMWHAVFLRHERNKSKIPGSELSRATAPSKVQRALFGAILPQLAITARLPVDKYWLHVFGWANLDFEVVLQAFQITSDFSKNDWLDMSQDRPRLTAPHFLRRFFLFQGFLLIHPDQFGDAVAFKE